ncbi:hypothetical protein DITRI_Ditri07aG0159600 [Diplodiscus trichospermus]
MEPDDPFGWITEACQLSSSEESRLRHCSYFGQSDSDDSDSDSGCRYPPDIPVALTGITMVSPPESPQDELANDQNTVPEDQEIFHTPPEYRSTSTSFDNCNDARMIGDELDPDGETVPVDVDSVDRRRAVDLGRDTDLGFSEVEVDSTQRIEANSNPDGTFLTESEEIRVSKRGFSPKGNLSTESLSKRFKILAFESPSVRLGTPKERNTDVILNSLKKWNLKSLSPSPGASYELELENPKNREFNFEVGEGSVRNRRVDILTEVIDSEGEERNMDSENNNGVTSSRGKCFDVWTRDIECDTEERSIEKEIDDGEGNSGRNKNTVEDIDQVRYTGGNGSNLHGMAEKNKKKRALPSWANGRVGDDKRADEELDINERETIHSGADSDGPNENFEEINLLNVLIELAEECKEDRSLECLSLLEVAERKWGAFSSSE